MTDLDTGQVNHYLQRIGLDPKEVRAAPRDVETLADIQEAHVRNVPFENLAIIGDPFSEVPGEGVTLDISALYEKIVKRERGGYCFELNGLFTSLVAALGYDVHRAAAMVVGDDGDPSPPANHHAVIVSLDERYAVDVGVGSPQMRRPTPLAGNPTPVDAAGVAWRVVESDRPDTKFATQFRKPDATWETRYVFETTPRELSYFQATCDYLARAPESPFTGDPTVQRGTEHGWLELRRETLGRIERGEETVEDVPPSAWHDVLAREFGLSIGGG